MLKIDDLRFRYGRRGPGVLNGISLELRDGEIGVVLGRNGAGKTTLFKNILGLETPDSGRILFDGRDLSRLSRRERARRIAWVPQEIRFGALNAFDSVLMGRVAYFGLRASRADYEAVERILAEMGLEALAGRSVEALSGGERQKLAIARALAQEPRMLIFDEPTGNLDIANEQLILSLARRLAREKRIAILTALHDLNQAAAFGDRFYGIKDGEIRHSGGPECLTEDAVRDIFGIDVRILEIEGRKVLFSPACENSLSPAWRPASSL